MLQFEKNEFEEKKFKLAWWYLSISEASFVIQHLLVILSSPYELRFTVHGIFHTVHFLCLIFMLKKQSKKIMLFTVLSTHALTYIMGYEDS